MGKKIENFWFKAGLLVAGNLLLIPIYFLYFQSHIISQFYFFDSNDVMLFWDAFWLFLPVAIFIFCLILSLIFLKKGFLKIAGIIGLIPTVILLLMFANGFISANYLMQGSDCNVVLKEDTKEMMERSMKKERDFWRGHEF